MHACGLRRLAASAAATACALVGPPVSAFVTECHQDLSGEAFALAAWPLGAHDPPLSGDYRLLHNELAMDSVPGVGFWTLSALVGNRYNDGGPFNPNDFVALAEYAARPDLQRLHCLRAPEHDGPAGDRSALEACKAYIVEQIGAALGDADLPDLGANETVRLHLVFRGDADIPLQRFGFHLGQAIHALQDSFTHAFRSPDKRQVRTVLNWVDWLGSGYRAERDGFQHVQALDECDASDEGGPERRLAAKQATSELLAAVANDEGGRTGRLARAGAVVDAWFGIGESCTAENRWCDAPEQHQVSVAGCGIAGTSSGAAGGGGLGLLIFLTLAGRSRSRRSSGGRPRGPVVWIVVLIVLTAARAGAESPDGGTGELKGEVVSKATPAEQRALVARRLGILVQGGVSIDHAAYNVGGGVRYDLGKVITIGIGADYSPWLSIETGRSTDGSAQFFGVGVFRLDVRDYLELRTTVSAGVSVLMFDTWAARRGSVGPYFAVSPLGVGIRMTGRWRLLIDPAEIVVPIPQIRGIPLIYRQHRFGVGLQASF